MIDLLALKQQAGIQDNPDQEGLDLFAELIILKCAEIADKNSPLSYPDHGIKIKRHFGVE